MKTSFLTFVLIFNISTAFCQDSLKKFEIGPTLLTINSDNSSSFYIPSKPQFEIVNGIFFRISKKRLGLRFNASYSEASLKSEFNADCLDCMYGSANHKNVIFGIGGQVSLLKNRDLLYTYVDLNYRNVFSNGYLNGGFRGYNDKFTKTSNGVETNLGIAFKFKIFKSIYLSPELGYSIYCTAVNEKTTNLSLNTTTASHSFVANTSPFLKLHLTAKW